MKTRRGLAQHSLVVRHRPQPIRDAILAYLTEPRRAMEIAAHIGRSIATATGHLAAMKRRGLVVNVKHGVYARPDRPELVEKSGGPVVNFRIAA